MFNETMKTTLATANQAIENDKNIDFNDYDLTLKEARELLGLTDDRIEQIANAFRIGFYLGRYQVKE